MGSLALHQGLTGMVKLLLIIIVRKKKFEWVISHKHMILVWVHQNVGCITSYGHVLLGSQGSCTRSGKSNCENPIQNHLLNCSCSYLIILIQVFLLHNHLIIHKQTHLASFYDCTHTGQPKRQGLINLNLCT